MSSDPYSYDSENGGIYGDGRGEGERFAPASLAKVLRSDHYRKDAPAGYCYRFGDGREVKHAPGTCSGCDAARAAGVQS